MDGARLDDTAGAEFRLLAPQDGAGGVQPSLLIQRGGSDWLPLLEGVCLYPILKHPGWEDERHCHNGMWDYPGEDGSRELYLPLAAELQAQRRFIEPMLAS